MTPATLLGRLFFVGAEPAPPEPPRLEKATQSGSTDDLAAELDGRFSRDVKPLLAAYCLDCHQGEEAKGDLRLDELRGVSDAWAGPFDLRVMKEMVGSGEMPPKRGRGTAPPPKQPTEHERLVLTQWLDAMAGYVPVDAPVDPGWFTIHRLNRTEYRNTLRDLLGIDSAKVDVAAKLPRDDTGYGFDNVADVLSVSPLAVEEYLAAAERAVEAALGPVVEFGDKPKSLGALSGSSGQPLPGGGFFLYSNGPASAVFEAPLAGEYLVRVSAWETKAGDERSKMGLNVGKERVKEFSISGSKEKPQSVQVKVKLARGKNTISANFLNDFYVKDKADRNLGVESITVAGPLKEAMTERPEAWAKVFGAAGVEKGASEGERAKAVLSAFAERAYRRPVNEEQVAALMRLYKSERAKENGARGFEQAVRTAITGVLVSPNFLFRSVANPRAADPESTYSLDGYELASRLSYFLWSSMPDEALLAAAADGALLTDAGLSGQVKRMLADRKSDAFIENFSGQWLQLRGLERVEIDRAKFPEYDDQLRTAMTSEATLFVGDVLRSGGSVLQFVESRETFLNARLAKFYGVKGVEGEQLRKVALPEGSPRGGVLTMGAVLTLTSNTTRTSPVKRGLFVLDQILGAPPPPPPADIPPLEQAAKSSEHATVREQLAAHVAVASCAACHNRLDPIGLSFEHFDAIGKWRDEENGKPTDSSGTLPDGSVLGGAGDLKKNVLGKSDQFVEALSGKVLTYAIGRGVEPFDRPAVRKIAQRTRANGDRFAALIESVVLSETFRTCRGREAKQ